MLYAEGTLRAEDRALRQIARSKVAGALRSTETKTSQLLDSLISKLTSKTEAKYTVEQLLRSVLAHPQTRTENAVIERYTRDFPELEVTVIAERERLCTRARARLEQACAPHTYARRFRYTKGEPSH